MSYYTSVVGCFILMNGIWLHGYTAFCSFINNGHLDCFCNLAILNTAAPSINLQGFGVPGFEP